MSLIFKIIKYSVLLFIAFIFFYFSINPGEYQKYLPNLNTQIIQVVEKFETFLGLGLSKKDLDKINSTIVYVNFPQKSQSYKLSEIGVSFDSNRKRIVDEKIFNEFKTKVEKELSYLSNSPIINLERNEFYALGKDSKIGINQDKFLEQLQFNRVYGQNQVRVIPLFDEEFSESKNKASNEELISKISKDSLLLKAGRKEFLLDTKTISNLFLKKYEGQKEIVAFDLNKIEEFLKTSNDKIKFPTEVNYKLSSIKLATHLAFRITEERPSKTFILPIDGGFTLSPEKHQKFIEVNKSQQRAYLFENGKLVKTLIISTGVTWETPLGEFKVLNKVPMTISYTNNWYMPWYLPIGTINGSYYFGFHEVPYHMDHKGLIYSRDPETIGSPATGGCIQVLKGQAKELFEWASVGMPVYITE